MTVLGTLFLVAAIAAGHVAVFVYLVNVIHAFGSRERTMSVCKISLLVWLILGGVLLIREGLRVPGPGEGLSWMMGYAWICLFVGTVAFPAFTMHHHLRSRPRAIEHRSSAIDLAARHGLENLVGDGRYAGLLRLSWNESLRLRKVDWEIEIPDLPEALDGLTVLQVSDLHFAPCFKPLYFETVIGHAAEMEADLVVFTGDLVDHDSGVDWIEPILSRLKGKAGTYAILGNHDYEHHAGELLDALESAGFETLEGKSTVLQLRGKRIEIAGTSSPWGPLPDLSQRPKADFSILLSHCPDLFHWASGQGFHLMFSGHNHGGQIRLPLVGPVFMPSRYSRKFDRGFFRDRQLTLHVCQGIAGKQPIRHGGCIPELNRLTLRSKPVLNLDRSAKREVYKPAHSEIAVTSDTIA